MANLLLTLLLFSSMRNDVYVVSFVYLILVLLIRNVSKSTLILIIYGFGLLIFTDNKLDGLKYFLFFISFPLALDIRERTGSLNIKWINWITVFFVIYFAADLFANRHLFFDREQFRLASVGIPIYVFFIWLQKKERGRLLLSSFFSVLTQSRFAMAMLPLRLLNRRVEIIFPVLLLAFLFLVDFPDANSVDLSELSSNYRLVEAALFVSDLRSYNIVEFTFGRGLDYQMPLGFSLELGDYETDSVGIFHNAGFFLVSKSGFFGLILYVVIVFRKLVSMGFYKWQMWSILLLNLVTGSPVQGEFLELVYVKPERK